MTAILILALVAAQQLAPPEKCTISGTVVDAVSGQPLSKATVIAKHPGNRNEPGAYTTTDAKGVFHLVDIDPGQYRLSATRNGYLESSYGAKKANTQGSTITLTAGRQLDALDIKMTPFGVISGVMRDADGEPLPRVRVELFSRKFSKGHVHMDGEDTEDTNDLGEYRFADLAAGRYVIVAVPDPDGLTRQNIDHSPRSSQRPADDVATFFPGTTDPAAASLIDVQPGARVTNLAFSLVRANRYTVKVHIDAPSGTEPRALLKYPGGEFNDVADARADKDGQAELKQVPSGVYELHVDSAAKQKPFDGTVEIYGNHSCGDTAFPLVVDRADIEGLRVAVRPCGVVTGRILTEPAKASDRSSGTIFADFEGDGTSVPSPLVKPDGTFSASLAAGRYIVEFPRVIASGKNYVKSIRAGNQDLLRNGFTIAGGEQIEIEVTLATDGSSVAGTVKNADDQPTAGATVVLIPNDPALRLRSDFNWNTVSDQTGHFEIKNAAPGDYKLFAWDDIEKDAWRDPDLLKAVETKGVPVTLNHKDSSPDTQTVNLYLIP